MEMINIKSRRYLGSKAKLLKFIRNVVDKETNNNYTSFCDLFAGTGNVASAFNSTNKKIIINDNLKSNYYSYDSWFTAGPFDKNKLIKLIEYYNNLEKLEDNYFSKNFSNTYFSEENCKKIGFIRQDIEDKYSTKTINSRERSILITSLLYAMDRIANTVGHYDSFRMHGDLNKKLVLLMLNIPDDAVNQNNEIYCSDSNVLAKEISADVVYIDPPYNSRQYCDAYHILENVATWNKPMVYGVAKKMDRKQLKSAYCTVSAVKAFEDLIKNLKCKFIVVSYNNTGKKGAGRSQAKISDDDILRVLGEKGLTKIFETSHNQFTTGASDFCDNKERLFVCHVGTQNDKKLVWNEIPVFVKSPLNYTGGKFKLLKQLLEKFPSKIGTFIDLFGGGFNVGANIDCDLIVYNDKQKEVMRLIKLFYENNYFDVERKIESIITEYNLSNTYDFGYKKYNCDSSSGVGSYNKSAYMKLRDKYNSLEKDSKKKDYLLIVLIIFGFNNQIRFNSSGKYNMPVGKRDFNKSIRKNLKEFCMKIHNNKIVFYSKSFNKINPMKYKNSFIYCDPPYLLGDAVYNENDMWNEKCEEELLGYLKKMHENSAKFALSNVIMHKGKTNELLKKWVDKNHFNTTYINSSYSNSNYHLKNHDDSVEVLITNY